MRVRIPAFTVEVDAEAWRITYGPNDKNIRKDVRSYIMNGIDQSPAGEECGLKVIRENKR
jgi:hypothetical protein